MKLEAGVMFNGMDHAQLRDHAQAAEALGFGLVAIPDHLVNEGVDGPQGTQALHYDPHSLQYDPMIAAAIVLDATKRMRVTHLVLCNLFRHPALAAQSLASLDQLSGGRMIAGLGTGYQRTEAEMMGIPFPSIETRLAMFDEALTCMRSLWSRERTNFSGAHYQFKDAILWPKPVQKPHLPVLIGGGAKAILSLAAKHADIVNIAPVTGARGQVSMEAVSKVTEQAYTDKLRFIRSEAVRFGRNPDDIKHVKLLTLFKITNSEEHTRKMAAKMMPVFGATPDEVLRSPLALVGTPEQCVLELRRRQREWGLAGIIFYEQIGKDLELMKRVATEIVAAV